MLKLMQVIGILETTDGHVVTAEELTYIQKIALENLQMRYIRRWLTICIDPDNPCRVVFAIDLDRFSTSISAATTPPPNMFHPILPAEGGEVIKIDE